jgi:hypothetical protein
MNFSTAYLPNRAIFYASMSMNEHKCFSCGKHASEIELTVVPDGEWFTPWTLQLLCYDCFAYS